jgi:hypothetical protein
VSVNGAFSAIGALLIIALVYVLVKNFKGTSSGITSLGTAGTGLIKAATGQG